MNRKFITREDRRAMKREIRRIRLVKAVQKGLRVCDSVRETKNSFIERMDNIRDFQLRQLAKQVGISFDDFCDELETLSCLET